jgi:serine/threonine protein kinase
MERMESSLYHNLHVQKRPFVELERLHVARSIASALVFVHAQNVMHRDLKSPNVLLGRERCGQSERFRHCAAACRR